MGKIIEQYCNGSYVNMIPGTVVMDYALSSYWTVVANNGKEVQLKNLKGGKNATKMLVSDETSQNTFVLMDVAEELNRYEILITNALEWAINVSEQHTKDLIRAMGITSEELSTIGYGEDNFPKMHVWANE